MSSQKLNLSPFSPHTLTNSNILQPKRLNNQQNQRNNTNPQPNTLSDSTSALTNRRILGQKGQLPLLSLSSNNGISHLSNQQLTSLLRNSPLDNCSSGSIGGHGSILESCNNNNNNTNIIGGGSTTTTTGGFTGSNTKNIPTTGKCDLVRVPQTRRAPTTMAKRNARERNRVKQVNQGFQTLRQHIPDSYRMKKMSKVDTLRCALDYIRNLEQILQLPLDQEGLLASPAIGTTSLLSPHHQSSTSTTISPSTSMIFSSEEDELFAQEGSPSSSTTSAFHFDTNQSLISDSHGFDKNGHGISLSSGRSLYNDENNQENQQRLENESLEIKIEACTPEELSPMETRTEDSNNYKVDVFRVSVVPLGYHDNNSMTHEASVTRGNNLISSSSSVGDVDVEMGIMTSNTGGGQSHGHNNISDGHSDTENYHKDESSAFHYTSRD